MGLFGSPDDQINDGKPILTEEEDAILVKLSHQVVKRGMAVPAIMFLESVKPLNFIGSQTLVFFEPIIQTLFNFKDYDNLRTALEKRPSIEILLLKIEEEDAIAHDREKRIKKFLKTERKKWKWYQRWLGIATPKFELPEDVTKPPSNDSQKK